jgi:hypothetical protein
MPPSVWTGWWRSFMRQPTEASRGVVKAAEYDKSTLNSCLVIARSGATKQSRIAGVVLDCFASLAMTS